MTTIAELLAQKEAIEQQIAEIRENERADAISRARAIVIEFELTADDLFSSKKIKAKRQAEAKYRNPETGETWTGRGRAPLWLVDKNRDDYLIG